MKIKLVRTGRVAIACGVVALAASVVPSAGAAPTASAAPASGINVAGAPYWYGQDMARGVALTHPTTAGEQPGGYVADAWGGIHEFGGKPHMSASHYTPGQKTTSNIALEGADSVGVTVTPAAKPYLFPVGTPLTENVRTCDQSSKFGVATRGISYDPTPASGRYNANGATIDAFGGIHAFCNGAPIDTTGAPYWGNQNWQIVYGIAILPGGIGGFTLDGYGGVHAWGKAKLATPPDAYWGPRAGVKAWNIARGVAIDGTGTTSTEGNGVVLDGFGGLHPFTYITLP
jgi:hypothetical protein